MKSLLLTPLFVLVASVVTAQTGATISNTLEVFNPGTSVTGVAAFSVTFPITAYVCNQVPPAPIANGVVIVPHHVVVEDSLNTTTTAPKVCIADLTPFFATLPLVQGDYLATIFATNDNSQSGPRSVASLPFRLVPPPIQPPLALRGLRVIP